MQIELCKPFARNGEVAEDDVKRIKKALNRLGYYTPFEKTGITEIPDAGVFVALKTFQKDHGLHPTGAMKPGDETLRTLSAEAAKTPEGYYIWRTVEDNRVRSSHATYNRSVRA